MHRRDTNLSGGAGWRCARGRLPAGVRRERRSAQPARRDGFAGDANALRAAHERRKPGRHRGRAVRGRGDHARHLRQPLVLEDRDQPLALPLCCQAAPIVAGKLRGADLARDLVGRVRELLGTRYTAITAVARGGNATLFGAYDQQGQQVAIKVLHPELAVSVAADRFLREIRYASQLHHPHIAPLLDSGETEYLLWFVMPFVPGESLRQVLRRERRLAISAAACTACEGLDALDHAHAHGIAHRDIKPDNIVLSPEGAVLVDLGIARAIATSGDDRVTRSGFVVGTEEYMSHEQAAGAPDVDGRTDLYSLGVVLFESLAGRPPFSSASAAAVLDMQQHHPPPDLRGLRSDVPKPLAAAVARALAKAREERWQTAGEMRSALLPFIAAAS